jgi:hypothetical protein
MSPKCAAWIDFERSAGCAPKLPGPPVCIAAHTARVVQTTDADARIPDARHEADDTSRQARECRRVEFARRGPGGTRNGRATEAVVVLAITSLLAFLAVDGINGLGGTTSPSSSHTAPSSADAPPRVAAPPRRSTRPNIGAAGSATDSSNAISVASPVVVLYGDSLANESKTYFQDALAASGITDVSTRTFGGTALCDWLDDMREDVGALRPTSVVIEFSGNAFTSCMHDASDAPLTGDAYYTKYFDDAEEALSIFAPTGARVFFVGTPLSRHAAETQDPNARRLNSLYAQATPFGNSEYVDAGDTVLDHGKWTETLPCLPNEPCNTTDANGARASVVRAPDGVHFCPAAAAAVNGVTGECPVWSSGAYRFGNAMATAVIRRARLHASGASDQL